MVGPGLRGVGVVQHCDFGNLGLPRPEMTNDRHRRHTAVAAVTTLRVYAEEPIGGAHKFACPQVHAVTAVDGRGCESRNPEVATVTLSMTCEARWELTLNSISRISLVSISTAPAVKYVLSAGS